ncbi:hypothetical protein KL918_001592 [Ogataea parapolymorpha]|nr:hypothetical protein KL918_001592 [Ogataea parapolymorpha]KAG7874030.1 hypothetical protein KL916_001804 [Ogataea parapolymorpha]
MSGSGASGNKFRMSLALPTGAIMNCADNSGARNLYVLAVKGTGARLNRLPAASVGDMVMATVKKGKPDLRKKVMPAIVVRQAKAWRRKDGVFLYFEDNAGVIVNPKGEMKGSAITGPVGKECADLWPRIASNSGVVALNELEAADLGSAAVRDNADRLLRALSQSIALDAVPYLRADVSERGSGVLETRIGKTADIVRRLCQAISQPETVARLRYRQLSEMVDILLGHMVCGGGELRIFEPAALAMARALYSLVCVPNFKSHLKPENHEAIVRTVVDCLALASDTQQILVNALLQLLCEYVIPVNSSSMEMFLREQPYYKAMVSFCEGRCGAKMAETETAVFLVRLMRQVMADSRLVDTALAERAFWAGVRIVAGMRTVSMAATQLAVAEFIGAMGEFTHVFGTNEADIHCVLCFGVQICAARREMGAAVAPTLERYFAVAVPPSGVKKQRLSGVASQISLLLRRSSCLDFVAFLGDNIADLDRSVACAALDIVQEWLGIDRVLEKLAIHAEFLATQFLHVVQLHDASLSQDALRCLGALLLESDTAPEIDRVVKTSLELVRDPKLCREACVLFCAALRKKNIYSLLDRSTLLQLTMAIDIFDMNGPHSVCAESLQFWDAVLEFCQPAVDELRDYFPDNKRRLRSKVVDWVLHKGFRPATVDDARAMAGFLRQNADLGPKFVELETALRGWLREMRPSREAVCWALLLCELGVADEGCLAFEPAFVVNCAASLGVAPRFVFALEVQPLDKMLLMINSGQSQPEEMAALATQLSPTELLSVCETIAEKDIFIASPDMLVPLVTAHETKTAERTVVALCRLLEPHAGVWTGSDAFVHLCDIYEYLLQLDEKKLVCTRLAKFHVLRLCIRVYTETKKQEDLARIVRSFTESSCYVRLDVAPFLAGLLDFNFDMLATLLATFEPQRSAEAARVFCQFCAAVSARSTAARLACFCNLLDLCSFENVANLLPETLAELAQGCGGPRAFLEKYKLPIVKVWMGFGRSVLAFPSELFSLDTRQFLQLVGAEVVAICLAYGGSGLIARVAAILERSTCVLVCDAVSLAVALAWTKNGCREKIFAKLEQHCGNELERQKCLVLDRVVELSGSEFAQFDLQIEDGVAELFDMVAGPVNDELVHFLCMRALARLCAAPADEQAAQLGRFATLVQDCLKLRIPASLCKIYIPIVCRYNNALAAALADVGKDQYELWTPVLAQELQERNELSKWLYRNRDRFNGDGAEMGLLRTAIAVLAGRRCQLDADDVLAVLVARKDRSTVQLLSALMEQVDIPAVSACAPDIAARLYDVLETGVAHKLRTFIARCLARTYEQTGFNPATEKPEFDHRVFGHVTRSWMGLAWLLDAWRPRLASVPARFAYLCLCGVLREHDLEFSSEEPVWPLDAFVWRHLDTTPEISVDIENPGSWAVDTFRRDILLTLLPTQWGPVATALRSLVFHDQTAFSHVLLYLLDRDQTKIPVLSKMLHTVFSKPLDPCITKEFIEFVLLLRAATIRENKLCLRLYAQLDLEKVYKAAAPLAPRAALMLMEEHCTSGRGKDWRTEPEWLYNTYAALDEKDLFFGLPLRSSWDYGVDRLHWTDNTGGRLMFDNARYNELQEPRQLVASLFDTGYDRLSSLLGGQMATLSYEQLWKLGEWKLPTPVVSDKHTAMYSLLKDAQNVATERTAYLEARFGELARQFEVFRDFRRASEWVVTLATFEAVQKPRCDSWLAHTAPFEIAADLYQARTGLWSRDNENGCAVDLHRYAELCRGNGREQHATNAAVRLACLGERAGVGTDVWVLSQYNVAASFWTQHETSYALETLRTALTRVSINGELPRGLLLAKLVQWSHESRQETADRLMSEYVETEAWGQGQETQLAQMYHILAEFCDAQVRGGELDKQIEKLAAAVAQRQHDLAELQKYGSIVGRDEMRRKNARRAHQRLLVQQETEQEELAGAQRNKTRYLERAVEFYVRAAIANDSSVDRNVDRLCALWLAHTDVDVGAGLHEIEKHKFVPWLNQLTSRLASQTSRFQRTLQQLVFEICVRHPYDGMYLLQSLMLSGQESADEASVGRGEAARSVWSRLLASDAREYATKVEAMAMACVELANRKLHGAKHTDVGAWWVRALPGLQMPVPTVQRRETSQGYDPDQYVVQVAPTAKTAASGLSLPKIVKVVLASGETHRMILKGGSDDLRQDSIMEQVFEKVNVLLAQDSHARRRRLRVRTYKVVPLGPRSGAIEFVSNSASLDELLRGLHAGDKLRADRARARMKSAQEHSPARRVAVYMDICEQVQPCFRHFFFNNYTAPDGWFEARLVYSRGLATTSIVGHVLGLGDRHCNNILVDKVSAEPIHIDLGVAFDQGRAFPVPEIVPFRLTRDLVDGLGVAGTAGVFSRSCENVFGVLRANSTHISDILDVLKYDPLYSWTVSPVRVRRVQEEWGGDWDEAARRDVGSEASMAIEGVLRKLQARGLSEEAVVRELVREATDSRNLALMYAGWAPFL